MKKIAVCIPLSWDQVPTLFLLSWTNILCEAVGKYDMKVVVSRSPYLDCSRDFLAEEALAMDVDYILWLDADQTYPANTPEILAKHIDSGKMVVGGMTPHRTSGKPIIYDYQRGSSYAMEYREKVKKSKKPIKVGGMGMGGVMVHPDVFAKKLVPPYFQMTWNPSTYKSIGEDVTFYESCRKAGVDVWCDTNLRYGHVVTTVRGFE